MSRLHLVTSGQGPVLVMLHGLFGSGDNFGSVALHLQRRLQVVRIDLPGHGQSPSLPELSIEAMAHAVLDELEAAGINSYHLLGHSLGGKVAMSMAGNTRGEGLEKLIVVDIAPKSYPPHHQEIIDALLAIDLATLENRNAADAQLKSAVRDAAVRGFLLKSLYRHESGRFRWRFDLQQLAVDYVKIAEAPVIDQMIEQPVLFVKGGKSDYLEPGDEPAIRQVCSQPSVRIIAGVGHWPHAEKPAQFTRACQEFLE